MNKINYFSQSPSSSAQCVSFLRNCNLFLLPKKLWFLLQYTCVISDSSIHYAASVSFIDTIKALPPKISRNRQSARKERREKHIHQIHVEVFVKVFFFYEPFKSRYLHTQIILSCPKLVIKWIKPLIVRIYH